MAKSQLKFWPTRGEHGGDGRAGKRKIERPIATKKAMHVTMRSEIAVGRWSFLLPGNRRIIEGLLATLSRRWRVQVVKQGLEGNHLHLVVKAQTRDGFKNFFRALGAQIAVRITGARKGKPLGRRFWTRLLWSRVITCWTSFQKTLRYVGLNELEGLGLVPRRPKGDRVTIPA